jgi:hypothetical protein
VAERRQRLTSLGPFLFAGDGGVVVEMEADVVHGETSEVAGKVQSSFETPNHMT